MLVRQTNDKGQTIYVRGDLLQPGYGRSAERNPFLGCSLDRIRRNLRQHINRMSGLVRRMERCASNLQNTPNGCAPNPLHEMELKSLTEAHSRELGFRQVLTAAISARGIRVPTSLETA